MSGSKKKPILIEKMEKSSKPKTFNIDDIFDHTFKKGKDIKIAPKEKETIKQKLAFSFTTRSQAGNSKTYYDYERF